MGINITNYDKQSTENRSSHKGDYSQCFCTEGSVWQKISPVT